MVILITVTQLILHHLVSIVFAVLCGWNEDKTRVAGRTKDKYQYIFLALMRIASDRVCPWKRKEGQRGTRGE